MDSNSKEIYQEALSKMPSYLEQVSKKLEIISKDLNNVSTWAELFIDERNLLTYGMIALMLDTGIYDFNLTTADLEEFSKYGIYSTRKDGGDITISLVFPGQFKGDSVEQGGE